MKKLRRSILVAAMFGAVILQSGFGALQAQNYELNAYIEDPVFYDFGSTVFVGSGGHAAAWYDVAPDSLIMTTELTIYLKTQFGGVPVGTSSHTEKIAKDTFVRSPFLFVGLSLANDLQGRGPFVPDDFYVGCRVSLSNAFGEVNASEVFWDEYGQWY